MHTQYNNYTQDNLKLSTIYTRQIRNLALHMGHELEDTLYDYWSRLRQVHNLFYSETMARDRFLHILCFMHFADSSQRPDDGEEYDWLEPRTVFDKLKEAYAKFCNPSEHLAVDNIILKFKARVIFRQCIPKKNKFRHQNLQTLWWIMVYIWHESVLG